jgi:hypothetical protein
MFTYASALDITRPAPEVFAAINDIVGWSEWTDMRDVRRDQPGPIGAGSTGTFTLPGSPFKGPIRFELIRFEPNRRVTYEVTHRAFAWTAELNVAPSGAGSRLETAGTFRLRGWWRLLQPIISREVSRGEAGELERMKAILEAEPSAAITAVQES